jgi:hypothetical protein
MVANAEKSAYYPHTMPDHGSEIVDEGKWQPSKEPQVLRAGNEEKDVSMQHVVFQRRHIALFNKALRNPNHRLRQAAERAMQGFAIAAEEDQITTLNRAASDYGIPVKNLSEWVAKGVIPYESRDKYAIYVRRETLDKIAPVYHEAKEQGKLAAPLLKKMHDELFPTSPASSQK